jgi:site-specific recombinase XerD
MTSIKLAVLRHTRAKDGSYKIRISIGHKSETHYIVTKYRVASLSNWSNGVVVGQPDAKIINLKLRQLLNEYDERLERVPNPSDYSCEELRNLLRDMRTKNDSTTLQEIANIYIGNLRNEKRESTARIMEYQLKRFQTFTHGNVFLSDISPRLIDEYTHQLRMQEYSSSYINISLSQIKTMVNYAIKMQYVSYEVHPFAYSHNLPTIPRDTSLPIEDIRKIYNYHPKRIATRRNIDLFMLSFMLGGMNMKDLLKYDFRDATTISYIRQKTKLKNFRPTEFTIPDEAFPIINRWMDAKTGRLKVMRNVLYGSFLSMVTKSLKNVANKLQLSKTDINFYSARKSFVQIGFDLGIPLEILEYCVGQTVKTNRPIFNYAKIMSKHADDAIRKILDELKTSPSITDEEGNSKINKT